jgi:hypothetical protein
VRVLGSVKGDIELGVVTPKQPRDPAIMAFDEDAFVIYGIQSGVAPSGGISSDDSA